MFNEFHPANVFRYCPRCGHPGIVSETINSLKCINCDFKYYFNMSAAVAAIIRNDKNEILFTIRRHEPAAGFLDLPGGFVNLGETAEDAIKREVFEELNLVVNSHIFIGTFANKYLFGGLEYQTLDLVFECTVKSLNGIKVADDVSGFVFKNPKDVKSAEIGLASVKEMLKLLQKK